jgi:branched-chain amino acid aminotransferase
VTIASKSFGWNVEKRPVKFEELDSFSEVMAAGTAASLVPIKSITMRSKEKMIEYLTSEEPGELCLRLLKALQGIQRGEEEDVFGWCQKVKKPEGIESKEIGGGTGKGDGQPSKKSAEADQLD